MPGSRATEKAENHVNETIVLRIPTDSAYRGVASLVLGGLGSRLDLPYERMDDLQLAVLSMLDASRDDDASVEIHAEDDHVAVSVGPLHDEAAADDGLELVLTRLTDRVEAARRDDASWITVFMLRAEAVASTSPPSD